MTKGFLYAVRMVIPDFPFNPVKIGFTTTPESRSKFYGGSGPFPIEWLGMWPAESGIESEAQIHVTFAAFRLHGEWFFPHPDLLGLIDRKLKAYPEHQETTERFGRRKVHRLNAHPLHKGKRANMIPAFIRRWEDAKTHLTSCPSCSLSDNPANAAPLRVPNVDEVAARVEAYIEDKGMFVLNVTEAADLLGVAPEQVETWRKQGLIGYLDIRPRMRYSAEHLREAIEIMRQRAA